MIWDIDVFFTAALPYWAVWLGIGVLIGAGGAVLIASTTSNLIERLVTQTKRLLDILEGQQAPLCGIVGFFVILGKVVSLGPKWFVKVVQSPTFMVAMIMMSIAGGAKKEVLLETIDRGKNLFGRNSNS